MLSKTASSCAIRSSYPLKYIKPTAMPYQNVTVDKYNPMQAWICHAPPVMGTMEIKLGSITDADAN
jgi:hypothetical protein